METVQNETWRFQSGTRSFHLGPRKCAWHWKSLFTQTYWYDSLNRLQAVKDSLIGVPTPAPAAPVGVDPATQVFAYDRYGNRALVNGSYSTGGSPVAQASGTPTAAQLEAAAAVNFTNNRTNAYTHDSSGNVLNLNGTSTYDGENRLVTATYIPDPTMTNLVWTLRHTYDGDGRRVKTERVKPDSMVDTTTTYVYGAGGELVQEYGSPVVTPGRTYLTGDALGSTRLVTKSTGDATAIVSSRHDYLPFGEEINRGAGVGGGPTQRFTGKERDAETGLDYFLARYMSPAQGRFTSPDPDNYDARLWQPQSWNMYGYVWNNPIRHRDDDGRAVNGLLAVVGGVVGFGTGVAGSAYSQYVLSESGDINWKTAASYGVGGAISGATAGLTFGGSLLATSAIGVGVATAGNVTGGVVSRGLAGESAFDDNAIQGDVTTGLVGGSIGSSLQFLGTIAKVPLKPKSPSPLANVVTSLKRLAKVRAWEMQEKALTDRPDFLHRIDIYEHRGVYFLRLRKCSKLEKLSLTEWITGNSQCHQQDLRRC